jgi:replicative DNA helicase
MASDVLPNDIEHQLLTFLEIHEDFRFDPRVQSLTREQFSDPDVFERIRMMRESVDQDSAPPSPTTTARIETHADQALRDLLRSLRLLKVRREAIRSLRSALNRLESPNSDLAGTLGAAFKDVQEALREGFGTTRQQDLAQTLMPFLDHLDYREDRDPDHLLIPTPFDLLNTFMGGLLPGRIYLIIGPGNRGLGTMAVELAAGLAGSSKYSVGFVSNRMSLDEIGGRMMGCIHGHHLRRLHQERFGKNRFGSIRRFLRWLPDAGVQVAHEPELKMGDIETLVLGAGREGPSVLILDGFRPGMFSPGSDWAALNRSLRPLRAMAKELRVAVVLFSTWEPKDEGEEWKAGHSAFYDLEPEYLSDLEAEVVGLLLPVKRAPRMMDHREGWEVRELILFRNAFGERSRHWFQFHPNGSRAEEMRVKD